MPNVGAKTSFGVSFSFALAGITPLVEYCDIDEITPPSLTREMIDATTHCSSGGAREFIPEETYDPGEVTLSGNYTANSALDIAVLAAMAAASKIDFKIGKLKGTPALRQKTASGYFTDYSIDSLTTQGKQRFSIKIKVTSVVTEAVNA